MEQHRSFEISPKSSVEYKRHAFHFYSHLEGVKPLILNKTAIKKLLASFKELKPLVHKEQFLIQDDLEINGKLIEAGRDPLPAVEKLVYSQTLAQFKVWEIRQQVNKYDNNIYIWTKLYVQDKEAPTTYYPCKGGILWADENYESFEKFVDDCILNRKK